MHRSSLAPGSGAETGFVSTAPTDELRRTQRRAFLIAVNTLDRDYVVEWLEGFARFGNDLDDGVGHDPALVERLAQVLRSREIVNHPAAARAEEFCAAVAKRAPSTRLRLALDELRESGQLSAKSTQELEAAGGAALREAVIELADPAGAQVLFQGADALDARGWFLRGYAFEHGFGCVPSDVSAIASYAFALKADRRSRSRLAGIAVRLAALTERRAGQSAEDRSLRGALGFAAPMYDELADMVSSEATLYRSPHDADLWLAKAAVRGSSLALRRLVRMHEERTR